MSKPVLPVRYIGIEEECARNPELKISDLEMLKEWMDKQPHLPNMHILYFVIFLHSNYYRIEPTKNTIEHFFTARTLMPEIFSNRDPVGWKELRKAFNVIAAVPLEQTTKEGYIITYCKLLDTNPNNFDYLECAKYLFMTTEVQAMIRGTSNGLIVIVDVAGALFGHIARMNLMYLRKILYYIQEGAPVRLQGIHILNTLPLIDTLFSMIKPFVKTELLKLMHVHSNLETLKEFVPIEALPNESGGKAGPLDDIIFKHIKLLEEFRDWFEYDETIGKVNESLRVGKCQTVENLFGVEGSFKKLDID